MLDRHEISLTKINIDHELFFNSTNIIKLKLEAKFSMKIVRAQPNTWLLIQAPARDIQNGEVFLKSILKSSRMKLLSLPGKERCNRW